MTDDANLLEMLDTTVTLEWDSTRSIGTLIQLGGRVAQLTSLRAPAVGTQVDLRIENDDPALAMSLNGRCASVVDSDWGEQQVEVLLERIGTSASAAVLREFIEKHGIDLGGSVSVGRNRDNPEIKRFVYALPTAAAEPAEQQAPRRADAPQAVSAPAAVAAPPLGWAGRATQPQTGPMASAVVPQAVAAPQAAAATAIPLGFAPSAARTADPDLASALLDAMNAVGAQTPRAAAPAPQDADATRLMTPVAPQAAAPQAARAVPPAVDRSSANPVLNSDHDTSEQILVHIVDASSQAPAPVVDVGRRNASSSVMQRILGGIGKGSGSSPSATVPGVAQQGPGVAPLGPARLASSDKLVSAAELYTADQALRADLKVQFEVGPKKRKVDGQLMRIGESKLRVSALVLPAAYERVVVYIPGKGGPKDVLALQCQVTRAHVEDANGGGSFDARLTAGGNPAPVMAKLRQLLHDLAGGAA